MSTILLVLRIVLEREENRRLANRLPVIASQRVIADIGLQAINSFLTTA
jgi:hypothetical protein